MSLRAIQFYKLQLLIPTKEAILLLGEEFNIALYFSSNVIKFDMPFIPLGTH